MRRRFTGLGGLAATVAATALVVAVQAGAGTPGSALPTGSNGSLGPEVTRSPQTTGVSTSVRYVSGYSIRGKMRGSLKGAWTWSGPNDGFDAFLKSLTYNRATGVMRFHVREIFKGSIAGLGAGTMTIAGANVHVFKPGTPLYDFSTYPSPQPGTTGDPKQWLGGWSVHTINGGTGAFKGASGVINYRDIRVLTDANYWGIVRLKSAS